MSVVWTPKRELVADCRTSKVAYQNGPLYDSLIATRFDDGKGNVSMPAAPGTVLLGEHVKALFGVPTVYYTRRKAFKRGEHVDLHVAGRAIDFMNGGDIALGTEVADYLLENHETFGIQFIVYCHNRFSAGRHGVNRFGAYTRENKHTDHVHCEFTIAASKGELEWYKSHTS